ncbi:MAG: sodium-dependent transporter [Deltaproteobacteria bacterium]|jgi:NSS family neurotransmitter:Na+ symporter|nr:sodium-dependent transporter [Deltaproteobacteria bacterium]
MSNGTREHWSAGFGFTLAAVGSAVGLGNMWRFSYMAAENGGAAFVVLYVVLTLLVGLPVMLAELALGRGAGKSPIQALVHYGGAAWRPLGVLFVVSGFVILAYYSVIAGWTARYVVEAAVHGFPDDAGAHFGALASGHSAALWHLGFMGLVILVVSGGIRGGIERASLVLMPLLGFLVIALALYAATLEGAVEGYRYYFTTDFLSIFDFEVLKDAAGQAFFSLSLGMGAILTYASYLSRDRNLPREAMLVAISDFGVAFVAGLVVFPLVFALGLQEDVSASTLGALFVTLPKAFATMGGAGRLIGVLFMVALVVGGLTSAISLLEVVVSSAIDGLDMERGKASWVAGGAIAALGLPSAYSLDVLGLMDQVGGNLLLVLGGLSLSILVGWVLGERAKASAAEGAPGAPGLGLWIGMLRFVVPPILIIVLVFSAADSWKLIVGLFEG